MANTVLAEKLRALEKENAALRKTIDTLKKTAEQVGQVALRRSKTIDAKEREIRNLKEEVQKLRGEKEKGTPREREFLRCILELAQKGRRGKYRSNVHLCGSLSEEVGEVHRAYIKGEGPQRVREEALDVGAVALRVFVEGDASYGAPLVQWPTEG